MSARVHSRVRWCRGRSITLRIASLFAVIFSLGPTMTLAGDFFGHPEGLFFGGSRWDAAPRTFNGLERSLVGGLRYSLDGGSYEAYRNSFQWSIVPSVADFQLAVERAFAAWTAVDPASGLATDVTFVADLATPVVGNPTFGGVNINGAEIDLLARNAGDSGTRAVSFFNHSSVTTLQLTSGTTNYPGAFAINGADITINNNPGAIYSLNFFRRLLTHEIGHAIGLGDVENAYASAEFVDDNFDPTNSATMRATLTNSWAGQVDVLNPAASPLSLYQVPQNAFQIPGVDILMESNGVGIGPTNPVTELVPLRNDEYGMRQFLYPFVPEPQVGLWMAFSAAWFVHKGRFANR